MLVLDALKADDDCTAEKLADSLGLGLRTVKRAFSSLKDKGLIIRVGSDKTGHWTVLNG